MTSLAPRAAAAAGLAAVLALSACAPGGEASATVGGAEEEIVVGLLTPTSGTYAALGTSINNGFELYLSQHGGRLGGKKIKVVKADSQADSAVAIREVNRLVDRDGAKIITGMVSSGVAVAVRDAVDQKKIPTFVSLASANVLAGAKASPYVFHPTKTNAMLGQAMGSWAHHTCTKAAVLGADYAAGKEVVGAFKTTFTENGGTIVNEAYPPLGNADFSSFLTAAKQAQPECVFAFFAGSDAVRFVEQYKSFGLSGTPLLGTGAVFDEEDVLPSIKGELPQPSYSAFHQSPSFDGAANQAFIKAYQEKFQHLPGESSTSGYVSAQVMDKALQAAGGYSDIAKLNAAVQGLKLETAFGPMTFNDKNQAIINVYINDVVPADKGYTNKVVATVDSSKLNPAG